MNIFKKILLLILCIAGLFFGMWIAQDNTVIVTVTLLGFAIENIALGVWLLIMLLVGVALSLLSTLPAVLRLAKYKNAEKRERLTKK